MSDIRAKLRAKTIGAKKVFRRESVEFEGDAFEFIQPTLGERKSIVASVRNEDGEVDDIALMVESVIALTVVPGTTDRVFEDTDRESMLGMPSGSFVEKFAEKAVQVLVGGVEEGPLDAEDA